MSLNPNLEKFVQYHDAEHDNILSIVNKKNQILYVKFKSKVAFNRWHKVLSDALTETVFSYAFKLEKDGTLSVKKLEMAIHKCSSIVDQNNLHVLKAKHLWNIKMECNKMLDCFDEEENKNEKNEFSVEKISNFIDFAEKESVNFLKNI
jgi:hypothetical protein